jgi:hypothetical protein
MGLCCSATSMPPPEAVKLDLYASGTTGERIGTAGHVGAGLSVGF